MSIIESLAGLRSSSTFLVLKGYRSESGELADYQIVFHMSYEAALKRSLMQLSTLVPADELEAQAKQELVASYSKSLEKVQSEPLEVLGEVYDRVLDKDGNVVKGVKVHKDTGVLYLFGLAHQKVVREPGVYKQVNKRPLTVAKDKLRKGLPVERFRQFVIKSGQVESISVENLSLLPEV